MKVDEQNEISKRMRQQRVESRRGSNNKVPISEDTINELAGLEMRHISASIGDEQDSKDALSPMHHRMLKLINLSFASQT